MRTYLIAILSSCIFSSCQPLPDVPRAVSPPPLTTPDRYRLQVGDQFDVRFILNPELNESVTIQPDGKFSVLFAEDMQGAGLSLAEIKKALEAVYAKELLQTKLTLTLRSTVPTRIYVGGEVASPGEYLSVGPPLTLIQAIARAGGLKNSANPDQVVLIRRGENGTPLLYALSFNDATTGKAPSADVQLQPYDSLFVPRTPIANLYLAYQQYIQQFLPVTFGFSSAGIPLP